MKTRVILREDIPAVGNVGDAVDVSPGYARNFLFPLGKAYRYSADALLRVEKDRKLADERRLAALKENQAVAARLSGVQLTFEEKASAEGHLYGSVSAQRIAEALQEQGHRVETRQVRLAEPLRDVGEYAVGIHVHGEIEASIKVWVIAAAAAAAAAVEAPAEG